jgi:hypothetical protein
MNQQERHYLLPFDPVMQIIEDGLAALPSWTMYNHVGHEYFDVRQYVMYMLEWLSVKIADREATTAIDLAMAYLSRFKISEQYSREMSHCVMDTILGIVVGSFPDISFQQLENARYVMHNNNNTLSVYIR